MSHVNVSIDPKPVLQALSLADLVGYLVDKYQHREVAQQFARQLKGGETPTFGASFAANLTTDQRKGLIEKLRETSWFETLLKATSQPPAPPDPQPAFATKEHTANRLRWRLVHCGETFDAATLREKDGWRLPTLGELAALSKRPLTLLTTFNQGLHHWVWLDQENRLGSHPMQQNCVLMYDLAHPDPEHVGVRVGYAKNGGTTILVKPVDP